MPYTVAWRNKPAAFRAVAGMTRRQTDRLLE
jgi:hypothetical protein